jgi:radical SAM superfamily enzyme YgiQ (UPF0313 family)
MEANPETVTEERLAGYREAGVNRISFGVQSFRDEELRRLGRIHDAARAKAVVAEARRAGFDNLSLDLMLWLPAQRLADLDDSLAALIDLHPEHASLYLLELYPNAPLREEMARAGWSLAPDDDAADMYLEAMARLDAAGYEQYEISNVAQHGRCSRHNLKYWTDGEWVGGREIPGFLHCLVCKTRSAVAGQTLLRNIMNVHGVRLCRWVREDPLLSRAEHGVCIDAIWIESKSIDCPVTRCVVKAPVSCH